MKLTRYTVFDYLMIPVRVVQVLWLLRPTKEDLAEQYHRVRARLHEPTWYEL